MTEVENMEEEESVEGCVSLRAGCLLLRVGCVPVGNLYQIGN